MSKRPTRSGAATSPTVCPEFRVSMDAQMNHESIWNVELGTHDEEPNTPSTVTVVSLSGSDLWYACRVM